MKRLSQTKKQPQPKWVMVINKESKPIEGQDLKMSLTQPTNDGALPLIVTSFNKITKKMEKVSLTNIALKKNPLKIMGNLQNSAIITGFNSLQFNSGDTLIDSDIGMTVIKGFHRTTKLDGVSTKNAVTLRKKSKFCLQTSKSKYIFFCSKGAKVLKRAKIPEELCSVDYFRTFYNEGRINMAGIIETRNYGVKAKVTFQGAKNVMDELIQDYQDIEDGNDIRNNGIMQARQNVRNGRPALFRGQGGHRRNNQRNQRLPFQNVYGNIEQAFDGEGGLRLGGLRAEGGGGNTNGINCIGINYVDVADSKSLLYNMKLPGSLPFEVKGKENVKFFLLGGEISMEFRKLVYFQYVPLSPKTSSLQIVSVGEDKMKKIVVKNFKMKFLKFSNFCEGPRVLYGLGNDGYLYCFTFGENWTVENFVKMGIWKEKKVPFKSVKDLKVMCGDNGVVVTYQNKKGSNFLKAWVLEEGIKLKQKLISRRSVVHKKPPQQKKRGNGRRREKSSKNFFIYFFYRRVWKSSEEGYKRG